MLGIFSPGLVLKITSAYIATYTAIRLHELGHALVFRYFGCMPDLFDLYVPGMRLIFAG